MNTQYYILDEPLPLSQDFNSLKEMGLAYVQSHVGNEWTNLNTSDPGITILDQLCYALTELGYCNDFPVKDILTGVNGKLKVKDQFYLPEDILTTSPVTATDYTKYLIDGITGVNNAVILQAMDGTTLIPQTYQVYLLLDASVKDTDNVCWAAFVYLNKCRNLGELFLKPLPLITVTNYLKGSIEITNKWELNKTLAQINTVISNYIFPKVSPEGYTKLADDGVMTNEIFNGPLLKDGWISATSLVAKKNSLNVLELIPLIEAVPGVQSVSGLNFCDANGNVLVSPVTCNDNQLLVMDVATSFKNGSLTITDPSETLSYTKTNKLNSSGPLPEYETNIFFGASVEAQTDLPKGDYRNINSYYSIQNTFPAIYGIGADSVDGNAPDYQIAQSRQLKGYLTLFDQVLANQFSQLANIDKLFSFKNATTATPSDRETFYAQKDKYQKKHSEYPVPYLRFAPTYFFQSLYNVPYIKPLLKDTDTFRFSMEVEPEKVLEKKSWDKYKQDPYNAYIRGLMEIMEDESIGLGRRNEMLDHLLARHGESPLMINAFIDGSFYTKETLKDKVIFKSLYLQNLGLLSYYRYKAYDYLAADSITYISKEAVSDLPLIIRDLEQKMEEEDTIDFIFNSKRVDWREKLTAHDFVNFSGIELKLHLLFGLKVLYRDFIENDNPPKQAVNTEATGNVQMDELKNQALWFIEKRKGFMLVEMELLLQHFNFEFMLIDSTSKQSYLVNEHLEYANVLEIATALCMMQQSDLNTLTAANPPVLTVNNNQYEFENTSTTAVVGSNGNTIDGTNYSFIVKVVVPNSPEMSVELPNYNNKLEFLFPEFIDTFTTIEFTNRLNLFLQSELPVNVSYQSHLIKTELIGSLIATFVKWHESLRCTDIKNYPNADTVKCSWDLLLEIINLYANNSVK